MIKNRIIKLITSLIVTLMLALSSCNTLVYAVPTSVDSSGGGSNAWEDPIEHPDWYKPSSTGSEAKLKNKAGVILGVLNVLGVTVSVITLMLVGIKYMFGSIEEKAEYKKTMIMYLIGAALTFGITTIPNILYRMAQNI